MNRPHRYLVLVLFVILVPLTAFAQIPQKCPTVWISSPTTAIEARESLVFKARLTGLGATAQPEFHWEISVGTIVSGQGTPQLTLDAVGLGGQLVTAKVSIGGLATACSVEAAHSYPIPLPPPICQCTFDQYGRINFEDEQARLDNFVIQIFNFPRSQGYIIAYAGKDSKKGEAAKRLLRAKAYLVSIRQMTAGRIVTIDGGYKETFQVDLIVVPPGAIAPIAMPTLSPSEVETPKVGPNSPTRTARRNSRNK
jgi:hypothetical protein